MNQNKFIEELNLLGINPTKEKLNQLELYYEMLVEYNRFINLTGITEQKDVYLKHFYDSLTLSTIINLEQNLTLCDIGTGAGFPGIVLKIFYPNLKITLIDSLQKRINFLNDVINKLKLNNIIAIHSRIEEYGMTNKEKFDIVTARAVAPINVLLEYSIPILKINGYFIPMKANIENEDYKNALKILKCREVEKKEFFLPIENSKRTLIKIQKLEKTSVKYPRKYNLIKNKPL